MIDSGGSEGSSPTGRGRSGCRPRRATKALIGALVRLSLGQDGT